MFDIINNFDDTTKRIALRKLGNSMLNRAIGYANRIVRDDFNDSDTRTARSAEKYGNREALGTCSLDERNAIDEQNHAFVSGAPSADTGNLERASLSTDEFKNEMNGQATPDSDQRLLDLTMTAYETAFAKCEALGATSQYDVPQTPEGMIDWKIATPNGMRDSEIKELSELLEVDVETIAIVERDKDAKARGALKNRKAAILAELKTCDWNSDGEDQFSNLPAYIQVQVANSIWTAIEKQRINQVTYVNRTRGLVEAAATNKLFKAALADLDSWVAEFETINKGQLRQAA